MDGGSAETLRDHLIGLSIWQLGRHHVNDVRTAVRKRLPEATDRQIDAEIGRLVKANRLRAHGALIYSRM